MNFGGEKISEYCMICGECCRIEGYVFLSKEEAVKIAYFLKMDIFDFTEKYCEILNRKKLVLKNRLDKSDCIFLENSRCTIYEVRPVQCVKFPYDWTNGELPLKCIFNNFTETVVKKAD